MATDKYDTDHGRYVIMKRERLKSERQFAGLTQKQLAIKIGVSQQTVSKHENGIITPGHFSIIRQYERELGISAEFLFPDVFR
jgi:transcriptional regulator with XRE-family HTH domain